MAISSQAHELDEFHITGNSILLIHEKHGFSIGNDDVIEVTFII